MRTIGMVATIVGIGLLLMPRGFHPSQAVAPAVDSTTARSLQAEKSGCCSWHGGVCGCEGNRVVCCDGVVSPSCTC